MIKYVILFCLIIGSLRCTDWIDDGSPIEACKKACEDAGRKFSHYNAEREECYCKD